MLCLWKVKIKFTIEFEADLDTEPSKILPPELLGIPELKAMLEFLSKIKVHSVMNNTPLEMEFEVDKNGQICGELKIANTFDLDQDAKADQFEIYSATGKLNQSTDYTAAEVKTGREIKIEDERLAAKGVSGEQPDRTFGVDFNLGFDVPTKYTMKIPFVPPPADSQLSQTYKDIAYFDYDYTRITNTAASWELQLPDAVTKIFTNINARTYTAEATITRKDWWLRQNIKSSSVRTPTSKAPTKGGTWVDLDKDPNATYDPEGGGLLLHGNVTFDLAGAPANTIEQFNTVRDMRVWNKKPGGSDPGFGELQPWHDDCLGDQPNTFRPSWFDLPGNLYPLEHKADNLPNEIYLAEFLWAVQSYPEFGMLYYYVMIETKPNYYRLYVSPAVNVSEKQWEALRSSKSPGKISEDLLKKLPWKKVVLPKK